MSYARTPGPSGGDSDKALLLRFGLTQFFAGCAMSTLAYYTFYYIKHLGATDMQAGVQLALINSLTLCGRFVWGYLGDQFQSSRRFAIIAYGSTLCIAAGIWLLPKTHLWPVILMLGVNSFFLYPCGTILDSWYFKRMQGRESEFGKVKLGYPLGVLLMAPLSGLLIDRLGYDFMFGAFLVAASLALVTAFFVPDIRRVEREKGKLLSLRPLLQNRTFVFIVIWGVFGMISGCFVVNFFPLAVNRISTAAALYGVLTLFSSVIEVTVYRLTPKLIRRVNPRLLLAVALLCYTAQGLITAASSEPWQLFFAIPFQGVAISMYMFAMKYYISTLVPNELRASAQGMAEALQLGIGGVASGLIGGAILSTWSMPVLQRLGAALCFVCVAVLLAALYLWRPSQTVKRPA